jgi:amidophosphoribosyltransferase
MARIEAFIAFKAAIELLEDSKQEHIIAEVYKKAKAQQPKIDAHIVNYVKEIYAPFTTEQVSAKIAQMLKTKDIKADVVVIYQTVENLHKACPGGNRVVNEAFINYYEGNDKRAY